MRDISYRAKRKDNGEWVYGVPLKEGYSQEVEMLWYEYGSLAYTERAQVLPETVGQYTGLTDKNGKRIFEGDIVRDLGVYKTHLEYVRRGIETQDQANAYLDFKIDVVTFETEDVGSCGCCFKPFVGSGFKAGSVDLTDCEIIGNIHDNPELLEVK